MALFKKKNYIRINPNRADANDASKKPSVPDNMWAKCPSCKRTLYTKEMGAEKIVRIVAIVFGLVHGND